MKLNLKKIIAVMAFASGVASVQAQVNSPAKDLLNIYAQDQQQKLVTRSQSDRLAFYANAFFAHNTPYLVEPLGEGDSGAFSKAPLYRFDAFDCTTFVETVLALSFSSSPADFQTRINQIRYKDGVIAYEKRNHFPSLDWIPNNIKNGYLKDVTGIIAGQKTKWSQTWIEKGEWFRNKGPQFEQISHEFKPALAELPYISKEDLLASSDLIEKIPSGSIFHVVRPNWDLKKDTGTQLDISHMGFLVREQGILYMIHASNGVSRDGSDDSKRVKKEPLAEYIQRVMLPSPTTAGMNILAVREDRFPKLPSNE